VTSRAAPRLVPLIVASALFMENLDSSILATALPAIALSFDVSPLRLSLAISSYLLSLAVFIPVSGYVADRFGARRVFRTAIVVFTLGSLCCALAPSPGWLVAARALQGAGGAMMVPVGRLVVLRRVPKHDLVAAMAWITMPALVAPIMAPLVGGLIVTYAQWRWIFLINLPIGLLGFWLATRYVHDTPGPAPPPMDFRGWLLLGIGLVAVVFGAETIGKDLLAVPVIGAILLLGGTCLVLYGRHAGREQHPVLKLALLRLTTFRASMMGGSLFRIAAGGSSFLLPLMLQVGFGLSAVQSGALTFAGAVGALLMRSGATRLVRRIGFRRLLVADAAISAALISLMLLLTPGTPRVVMLALFFAVGFCRSLMFLCVNTMGYADVPERDMGHATSFAGTAQQLGLTVGVAITAQVLHVSALAHGRESLGLADFHAAWIAIALLTLSSLLVFRRLPPDAGSSVSGYGRSVRTP
jgi:EmrB/QacA subfamily drug resistance transporter